MLVAYSRLAVPCVPMYASCGFTEGRDESRCCSYRAIRPSDEICQRYISRVSEQFPQPPTITTMLLCATCSSSFLSYSYASPPSHLPLPSSTRRSAHSSFAIFLYQTVPQHLQVHSVSRQQPRGAGLHNRPGASRPGRTRSFARTSIARFSPKAAGLPWSVGRSTPTLTPPHVPEGLAVSCARRVSSPPRGPS